MYNEVGDIGCGHSLVTSMTCNDVKEIECLEDTALSLDIFDNLQVELATVGMADGAGEGLVGDPLGGGTGSGLLHHAVDLLERKTLGLGDQEPRVDESASTETGPDEEDRRSKVALIGVDHVGSDDYKE
jgi:hypothetical protein